jgi:hypothetical protein
MIRRAKEKVGSRKKVVGNEGYAAGGGLMRSTENANSKYGFTEKNLRFHREKFALYIGAISGKRIKTRVRAATQPHTGIFQG